MIAGRAPIIALWAVLVLVAIVVIAGARYVTDLSAFLPAKPTPAQQLLIEQLRDGPASRLILVALENGDRATRATVSAAMTRQLRADPAFADVENGAALTAEQDRDFLFQHRYLLSDAVSARRFSVAGLEGAIGDTIAGLATSGGLLLKSLVPHDPTGEMLHVIDQLTHTQGPRTEEGVWVSADGSRTLLIAQTRAAGSDTDGQERATGAIRGTFEHALAGIGLDASRARAPPALRLSGPGVFAVAARAKIERAATRLSILSSVLVVGVLLAVYRSVPVLLLGVLPVVTGALVGIAAVALGFGVVHGITLGFGITLIGESVDYSIYFFIQSAGSGKTSPAWRERVWPTVRLGMMTSVIGFASLLPSGFPGLAQLGLYSISGLVAAALTTRYLLPCLLPAGLELRHAASLGRHLETWRGAWRGVGPVTIAGGACVVGLAAAAIVYRHHETLWSRELSSLSPVSPAEQRYDATLRADLGAADVLDVVIVSGPDLQAVLRGSERAGAVLASLVDGGVIGDFDSPANYLPSVAAQQTRRAALPEPAELRRRLAEATSHLELAADALAPFVEDVTAARSAALVTADDLRGTSLATGYDALVLQEAGHWRALLPLHAPKTGNRPGVDLARVGTALAAAGLTDTHVLDFKGETDALYAGYLHAAMRLSAAGFVLIVLLLLVALRSLRRVLFVVAPLLLAVIVVAAGLAACRQQLSLLHLVGMLLIVAVGSNYALFFDHEGAAGRAASTLTLASLGIANLCTVIGFGLLSFSQVPVLEALGTTVAPGAFLALLFSALLTSPHAFATRSHA